ncbi:MAG: hypothetical protein WC839_00655 [Candidatus Paceibacterota bacterium]
MLLIPRRGVIFCALYSWFRPVDDIIDGEDPNPPTCMSDYITQKDDMIKLFVDGTLRLENVSGIDRLLVVIQHFARSIGIAEEIRKYVSIVWKHMVDEYQWRVNKKIPTSLELNEFACSQDEAIFRSAALVLGVDGRMLNQIGIDRLGVFTKTDWISDLVADLKIGLVHLPREVCVAASITYPNITFRNATYAGKHSQIRVIIVEEIQRLDVLWQKVYSKKEALYLAFTNKISRIIYVKIMNDFELSFRKIQTKYR